MRLKNVRRERFGMGSSVDISELGGTQNCMAETGRRGPAGILLARAGTLFRLEMFRPIRDELIGVGERLGGLTGSRPARESAQVKPFDLLLAFPRKLVHQPASQKAGAFAD